MAKMIICSIIIFALFLAANIVTILFFVSLPKKVYSIAVPEEYEDDAAELFKYNKYVELINSYTSVLELLMAVSGLACVCNGGNILNRWKNYYLYLILALILLIALLSIIFKIYFNKLTIKFFSGSGNFKHNFTGSSIRLGISYAAIILFTGYAVATLCLL